MKKLFGKKLIAYLQIVVSALSLILLSGCASEQRMDNNALKAAEHIIKNDLPTPDDMKVISSEIKLKDDYNRYIIYIDYNYTYLGITIREKGYVGLRMLDESKYTYKNNKYFANSKNCASAEEAAKTAFEGKWNTPPEEEEK